MTYSMLMKTSVTKYLYSAHARVQCKIIRISHYKMKGPIPTESYYKAPAIDGVGRRDLSNEVCCQRRLT